MATTAERMTLEWQKKRERARQLRALMSRDRLASFDPGDLKYALGALKHIRRIWLRDPNVVAIDVGYKLDETNKILLQPTKDEPDLLKRRPWIRVHVAQKYRGPALDHKVKTEDFTDYSQLRVRPDGGICPPEKATKDSFGVNVINGRYRPSDQVEGLVKDVERETENRRAADRRIWGVDNEIVNEWNVMKSELSRLQREIETRLPVRETQVVRPRHRVEPLVGGVSVGNARGSGGTLGAIVWDRVDGKPCILSNCHVLASGGARIGELCFQPSLNDGGDREWDMVARLKRWRRSMHVDAAIAELSGERSYLAGTILQDPLGVWGGAITSIWGDDPDSDSDAELLGLPVWKCGRTSGFTGGFVDGIGLTMNLDYSGETSQIFQDQLHIVPVYLAPSNVGEGLVDPTDVIAMLVDDEVTQAGDSGAVWVSQDSNKAIGLQFAGDTACSPVGEFAIANRINDVVEALDISFAPIFVSPREICRRRERAQEKAALIRASISPPQGDAARQIAEVIEGILENVLEKFTPEEVGNAVDRIRKAIGSQPEPLKKPVGG